MWRAAASAPSTRCYVSPYRRPRDHGDVSSGGKGGRRNDSSGRTYSGTDLHGGRDAPHPRSSRAGVEPGSGWAKHRPCHNRPAALRLRGRDSAWSSADHCAGEAIVTLSCSTAGVPCHHEHRDRARAPSLPAADLPAMEAGGIGPSRRARERPTEPGRCTVIRTRHGGSARTSSWDMSPLRPDEDERSDSFLRSLVRCFTSCVVCSHESATPRSVTRRGAAAELARSGDRAGV